MFRISFHNFKKLFCYKRKTKNMLCMLRLWRTWVHNWMLEMESRTTANGRGKKKRSFQFSKFYNKFFSVVNFDLKEDWLLWRHEWLKRELISIGEELCSTWMSGHLADVTLGPKEWTRLILALKRKWEELKSYL